MPVIVMYEWFLSSINMRKFFYYIYLTYNVLVLDQVIIIILCICFIICFVYKIENNNLQKFLHENSNVNDTNLP